MGLILRLSWLVGVQVGAKICEVRPKMAQDSPKMVQDSLLGGSKAAQKGWDGLRPANNRPGRPQRGLPLTWRDNPYPLTLGAGCDGLVGLDFQDFQDWTSGLDFWTFRLDFWICRLDFCGFLASES